MRRAIAAGLLLFLAPAPGGAQSLFSAGGLGIPLEALDARARALGSVSVGLFGVSLLPADPAGAGSIALPTISASLQPSWGRVQLGEEEERLQGNRFPLTAIGIPVPGLGGVATIALGGFLEQRWNAHQRVSVNLAGDVGEATDSMRSDGGVSAIRLGWTQPFGSGFAAGASVGRYIGSAERVFVRRFDSALVAKGVQDFIDRSNWRYGGLTARLGASWEVEDVVRIAASVRWSGALRAEEALDDEEEGAGRRRDYDVPMGYAAGASARLTPSLILALGFSYADWTAAGEDFSGEGRSGPAWSFGAGLELEQATLLSREIPLRIGYRRSRLPFDVQGERAGEWSLSAGLGAGLFQTREGRLVTVVDAALERGGREAGAMSERFWRATLSLRLAGR